MDYFNENDEYAAQWLRNLIGRKLLRPGVVDARSITDVAPDDLREFRHCHFFAGIGGWALAVQLAGYPADRPLWTGSCPCQPFSAAGEQRGIEDGRHLWPAWFRLIRERLPAAIVGEQVAGAAGLAWLDHVLADLEDAGYAAAAAVVPACAVGAPHRRDRLWFVADRIGAVGHSEREGLEGHKRNDTRAAGRSVEGGSVAAAGGCILANSTSIRSQDRNGGEIQGRSIHEGEAEQSERCRSQFWQPDEWIICNDGKARRIKSGLPLLAYGVLNRVGRLRAFGNAIVPQVGAEVLEAFMKCRP